MSLTAGILNVVLGAVYTSYGFMTVADLWQRPRGRGFSVFGVAWIFMAFTCGPHHLHHGVHILFEGRSAGVLDLTAVAIGFPAGVAWFLLRVEGALGGRGERAIPGTPAWIELLPALSAVYLAALAAAMLRVIAGFQGYAAIVTPNLALVGLYTAIGAVLLRTQLLNRRATGRWSLSGLSLTIVFPTCALMHGAYALYASTGRYVADWHGFVIDAASVPASVFFLAVIWALSHGFVRDPIDATTGVTRDAGGGGEASIEVGVA